MKFTTTHLIICFILISIPHVTSLNFSYTFTGSQNPNPKIVIERDAAYSDDGIQLTPDRIGGDQSEKVGRVIYFKPLPLWNSTSNGLASFSTNFTFVIDSNGSTEYGYGLTFFLAENNSLFIAGGSMGLPITPSNSVVRYRFVAVEFDTFWDRGWDPKDDNDTSVGDHVGISNSVLYTSKYRKWFRNVTGGGVCQAWIRYDSCLKSLSVSFTGYQNNTVIRQDEFSRVLDLRKELPEQVIFGFSAATGVRFQKNIVRSWSFESSDFEPSPDPVNGKNSRTTMLAGTLGYMSPECVVTGKACKESDVFSFGVVALEIACGRKPIEYKARESQTRLVEWVWELYGTGNLLDAVDHRLGLNYKVEEIKQLMIIGLWCAHPDSKHRPSMRQVIQVLNSEASLPILPSEMPIASYNKPSMSSLFGVASLARNQSICIVSNTDSSKQMTSSTASSCSPSVSLLHQEQ
ncbi:hypothetical protein L1987_55322 [Smallanthus sonchifolius]|uniref:Uncharacterized protein n=1 Tax=Smallanthus sonchifolius TaxID=185202 RepID=A0ACB9E9J9_9ASTR|nr:hypothetical protein L1987_55322 [Smallanthus sonchifolius]